MTKVIVLLARFGLILLISFIAFSTLSPIEARPHVTSTSLEHVAAFTVLGMFACLSFSTVWKRAVLASIMTAIVLEFAQHYVPGRHARVFDLLEKCLGVMVGVALFLILGKLMSRLFPRSMRASSKVAE